MIRVALDVLGGDSAPASTLEGARQSLEHWPDEFELVLVGPRDVIQEGASRLTPHRVSGIEAPVAIDPSEPPALAVRRTPHSSVARGVQAVRDGRADAFVSAGPTGATMVASVLTLGLRSGVDRPPAAALFPTTRDRVLVLDVGANVNVEAHQLHQFGQLGAMYARGVMGRTRPRVGLLAMGEEEPLGGTRAAAYRLLSDDSSLNFIGSVEGHRILTGHCDVVVCGGFVGNVLLKFYESLAGLVTHVFEQAGVPAGPEIETALRSLDYTEYGGAPLLGVNGIAVICHSGSPPSGIMNGIRTAFELVGSGFNSIFADTPQPVTGIA